MSWISRDRSPTWWGAVAASILSLVASGVPSTGSGADVAQSAVTAAPQGASEDTSGGSTPSSERAGEIRVLVRAPAVTSDQASSKVKVAVRSTGKHRAGTVVLKTRGRVLARGKVDRAKRSRVKLTMPALSPGTHRIRAVYKGRGAATRHRSRVLSVRTVAGCAGDPSVCGFPDAGNTGPRAAATLRDVPGDVRSGPGWHYDSRGFIQVDGDGARVSGLRAKVGINVEADDVVIQDVHLTVKGEDFGVAIRRSDNVTIQYSTITAPSASGPERLMVGVKDIYGDSGDIVVAHNDISRTATGVQLDHGVVESNFIHDLGYYDGDHVNGTTSNGGGGRLLVLRGNTIFNPHDQTDAISLFQDFGQQHNRVIEGNLLAGGGYTVYGGAGDAATSGIVVRNNRFARIYYPRSGYFGPATYWEAGPGNAWVGNVWDDSGKRISAP